MKELTSAQLDQICDKQLFYLPYFRGMLRAVEHMFYARLELPEPILDVGAGDGHFAWALSEGETIVGVDPWWQPLTEARGWQVYSLLTQAAGAEHPFPEATFPVAISNSVLEHIPDVQPVLNDVARVLKPGGMFYFAVPNQRFLTAPWGTRLFNKLGLKRLGRAYSRFFNKISRHHNLNTPETWLKRLNEAGFSQVEYQNYFPVWALQMLERGHAAGLPNLLWKKLAGRWVLVKKRSNPFMHWNKIRKLMDNPLSEDGTCTFYAARRDA